MKNIRKGHGSLEKTETRDAWIMMAPAIICLPVSYTHLDVYKRQI